MEMTEHAKAMRQARKNCGMTIKDLSAASGIHSNCIGGYELGKNDPSLSAVIALADALHMSVDAYVGHERKGLF